MSNPGKSKPILTGGVHHPPPRWRIVDDGRSTELGNYVRERSDCRCAWMMMDVCGSMLGVGV